MDNLTRRCREFLNIVNIYWVHINSDPVVRTNIAMAFLREFPDLMVSLQMRDRLPNQERIEVLDRGNEILMRGSDICDPYIRVLGPGITRITLYYDGLNVITSRTLNRLIAESCAPNLEEIRLIGVQPNQMDDLSSFPFVETVRIIDSDLGFRLNAFSYTFFPNVRNLEMENVRIDNILAHFEYLERLRIKSNSYVMNYGMRDATHLWCDNRNLRSLKIEMIGDVGMLMNDLLNSIQNNGLLSILSVKTDIVFRDVTRREIDVLITMHPTLRKLHLSSYMFSFGNVIYLINQLDSLQYFAYQITMGEEWNNAWYMDYIDNLRLSLRNDWQVRQDDYILLTRDA